MVMSKSSSLSRNFYVEPLIPRYEVEEVAERFRQQICFGSTHENLRDDLLFDFDDACDVNLFVRIVRHEQRCVVCVSLNSMQ